MDQHQFQEPGSYLPKLPVAHEIDVRMKCQWKVEHHILEIRFYTKDKSNG